MRPTESTKCGPSRPKGSSWSPWTRASICCRSRRSSAPAFRLLFAGAFVTGGFLRLAMAALSGCFQRIQHGAQTGDGNSQPGGPVRRLVADLVECLVEDEEVEEPVRLGT